MSDKIEYNDFGFAALDADELKSVDSTINSSTEYYRTWYVRVRNSQ